MDFRFNGHGKITSWFTSCSSLSLWWAAVVSTVTHETQDFQAWLTQSSELAETLWNTSNGITLYDHDLPSFWARWPRDRWVIAAPVACLYSLFLLSTLSWLLSAMPASIPVHDTLGALLIGMILSSMCVSQSVFTQVGSNWAWWSV